MKFLVITSEAGHEGGGLCRACANFAAILKGLAIDHDIVLSGQCANEVVDGGYDPGLGQRLRNSLSLKETLQTYACGDYNRVISIGGGRNAFMAMYAAKRLKLPLTIVFMGSDINLAVAGSMEGFWNIQALRYCDNYVVYSREMLSNATLLVDELLKPGAIIPNSFQFTPTKCQSHVHKPVRLCIGAYHLNEKKGIANFITALAVAKAEYGLVAELYLAGNIDKDIKSRYEDMAKNHHLENAIIFKGGLEREQFLNLLAEIDIYVQASFFEGCSYSVTEAIDRNKYLLLSPTGYFYDLLHERYPQIFFSSLHPEDMARKLAEYVPQVATYDRRTEIKEICRKNMNIDRIKVKWADICATANPLTAVMFHDINNAFSGVDYPIDAFSSLMELAASKGLRLCSMRDYLLSACRDNLVVCTFDDGYENVFTHALPMMAQYNFTATIFVCPDLVGGDNSWDRRSAVIRRHLDWGSLDQLVEAGWELGSHGLGHFSLLRLSQTELERSLGHSLTILEEHAPISCFCYPFGYLNTYVMNIVKKYYKYAFSVTDGGMDIVRHRYNLTRFTPEDLKILLQRM